MGNFNRGGKSFGGNRSFGGPKNFGDRGGKPAMHKATCGNCGDECEVPFRPTGDRPVFCSFCFDKQGGGVGNSRPSFGDRRERRDSRPSFDRSASSGRGGGDRQMFGAVCEKCGQDCQVPFRPTAGKPVFCDNCFDKGGSAKRGGVDHSAELTEINIKLDMIMTALGLSGNTETRKHEKKESTESSEKKTKKKKTETKIKTKKEVVKEDKKTATKKAPAKKVVAKKPATKKTVAKKNK